MAVLTMENPLREGMRLERTPDPCVMVIFGASGDLTKRKLIPALYNLACADLLPNSQSVIDRFHVAQKLGAVADALRKK